MMNRRRCFPEKNRFSNNKCGSGLERLQRGAQGNRLFTKVVYPTSRGSEVRTRLRLRGTVRGANNRLDILAITSYDRASGSSSDLSGAAPLPYGCSAASV